MAAWLQHWCRHVLPRVATMLPHCCTMLPNLTAVSDLPSHSTQQAPMPPGHCGNTWQHVPTPAPSTSQHQIDYKWRKEALVSLLGPTANIQGQTGALRGWINNQSLLKSDTCSSFGTGASGCVAAALVQACVATGCHDVATLLHHATKSHSGVGSAVP